MALKIDINCDLGESYGVFKIGEDEKIMPYITSANIACGFHAGDPMVMAKTVKLAKKHRVAVGAHPGYFDILGFGRRTLDLTVEEITNQTLYQVSALHGFAKAMGTSLQHVKPHGALYNLAVEDEKSSMGIVEAVNAFDPNLIIFAPQNSVLAKVAIKSGLRVAFEFFADRGYNVDGSLVSRNHPEAIIREPSQVVERTIKAVREGIVLSVNKEAVKLGKVHTVCIHGDTAGSAELAKRLKQEFTKANFDVKPIGNFI